jgi:hypothetical protein
MIPRARGGTINRRRKVGEVKILLMPRSLNDGNRRAMGSLGRLGGTLGSTAGSSSPLG